MANWKFEKWCADAASRIVYPPDRYAVERELRGHLQDHYEGELARGIAPKEAQARTLAAMGPAEDIAAELGMIHRPFWGRFHQVSRWIAGFMICLTLFLLSAWLLKSYVLFDTFTCPTWYRYDPFEDTVFSENGGTSRRLAQGQPLEIVCSGGYLFLLRQYALWEDCGTDSKGQATREDAMYLELQVISLVPWAAQTDISRWFGVRDDLGNSYAPAYARDDGAHLISSVYHTAPGISTHILQFSRYLSGDASRLELFCNRGGRNICLAVTLEEVAEQ